ncbi:Cys-tRNA(Pro) deacylase [Deferribacteraceae bacterium V6Fe1]|nr:Cys-tRNA(Pro) deacylase [Deferribacteraceae bacterium V6Fe1]
MAKVKYPKTNAIRFLEENKVPFEGYFYKYEERGGTKVSARELGVDEHIIVKTIIMEDDNKKPFIVLMHGDKEISTKNLARILNVKSVSPCSPETANKHSGYVVGGTSPFGTRKNMPVFMEKSILDLEYIFINGGKRGFLVKIDPKDVQKILNATIVEVGIDG